MSQVFRVAGKKHLQTPVCRAYVVPVIGRLRRYALMQHLQTFMQEAHCIRKKPHHHASFEFGKIKDVNQLSTTDDTSSREIHHETSPHPHQIIRNTIHNLIVCRSFILSSQLSPFASSNFSSDNTIADFTTSHTLPHVRLH